MTATRTVADLEYPSPGVWRIDPGHAEIAFIGRHFGLTKVRGRFTGVDGSVTVADVIADSTVDVSIDMASVHSGDQARDDHLRSEDFFDVERHPVATFRSTQVDVTGHTGRLTGDLTIRGVTKPVVLTVEYLGHAADPWGNQRAVFTAAGVINREDWGLTWNMLLDSGGLLVSKEIRIEIEIELIHEPA